jgi:hypothetical protein
MKTYLHKLFLFPLLFLFVINVNAQIPNGGFENWGAMNPVDWWSSNNESLPVLISQSSDAHSGSYAVKMEAQIFFNILIPAQLLVGSEGNGFPVSQRYEAVNFYYKFSPTTANAFFGVSVGMGLNDGVIGAGGFTTSDEANSYTYVSVPITYGTMEVPDVVIISFVVGSEIQDPEAAGSYATVDDVSFGAATDVEDANMNPEKYDLKQNYPNPFNPVTRIKYALKEKVQVVLKVYDLLGNEVATLVDGVKEKGTHFVDFNSSSLSSGTYFYSLKAADFVQTRKMILIK